MHQFNENIWLSIIMNPNASNKIHFDSSRSAVRSLWKQRSLPDRLVTSSSFAQHKQRERISWNISFKFLLQKFRVILIFIVQRENRSKFKLEIETFTYERNEKLKFFLFMLKALQTLRYMYISRYQAIIKGERSLFLIAKKRKTFSPRLHGENDFA